MWTISKLFEQTHTDPTLLDTPKIDAGFNQPPPHGWTAAPDSCRDEPKSKITADLNDSEYDGDVRL